MPAKRSGKRRTPGPRGVLKVDRVAAIMEAKPLSVRQLASRLGVSEQRVRQILERPRCTASLRRRLAKALGTTEAYLAGEPGAGPDGARREIVMDNPVMREIAQRMSGLKPRDEGIGGRTLEELPPRWQLAALEVYRELTDAAGREHDVGLLNRAIIFTDVGFWRVLLHEDRATSRKWPATDYDDFSRAIAQALKVLLRPFSAGKETLSRGGAALAHVLSLVVLELFAASAGAPGRSAGAVSTDDALVAASEQLQESLERLLYRGQSPPST